MDELGFVLEIDESTRTYRSHGAYGVAATHRESEGGGGQPVLDQYRLHRGQVIQR